MRRLLVVVAAFVMLALGADRAEAQLALRAGGGMIFEDSQLGGHVSLVLPFSNKPAGLMLAAEYYEEADVKTVPISARGLYKLSAGGASVYVGLGTGFIYTKRPGQTTTGAALTSISETKALFSAVGGLNLKFSGPLGLFGEVTLDRAFSSGADNNFAAKAGLSLTLID